ncbi:MAG: hypothetical protein LBV16_02620 [Elusimicrobiota bacterium]|nr:hypothetical protein [Elusimicrobiota bacterium]
MTIDTFLHSLYISYARGLLNNKTILVGRLRTNIRNGKENAASFWRQSAKQLKISNQEIDYMRSAFDNKQTEFAKKLKNVR